MSKEQTLVGFTFNSKEAAEEALLQLKTIDFVDVNVKIVASAFATKVSDTQVTVHETEATTAQKVAGAAGIGLLTAGLIANPLGWVVGGVIGGSMMGLISLLKGDDLDDALMTGIANKLETGQTALFVMYTGKLSGSMLDLLRDYDADLAYGELSENTIQATEKIISEKEDEILKRLHITPKNKT